MQRKRMLGWILIALLGMVGWGFYRTLHQSTLNHNLIVASRAGDSVTALWLLKQGADPNASEEKTPPMVWNHLLNVLLWRSRDLPRNYPLSEAMAPTQQNSTLDFGRLEIVRMLLEYGANPNVILPGETPLPLYAARTQNEGLLSLLLRYGADPNVVDTNLPPMISDGNSMLMYVLSAHKSALVKALLDHGARANLENKNGDTALMWAAHYRDIETIKLLLSAGAEVNHKNKRGHSALTFAVTNLPVSPEERRKDQEMVDLLLAAGADANARDQQGCSPFLFALNFAPDEGDLGAGSMLARGAHVNRPIPLTSSRQDFLWNMLGEGGSAGNQATPGTTPLMFAIVSQRADLVPKMLAMGADINARDSKGKTALYYADTCSTHNAANASRIRALLRNAGARR